MESSVNDTQRPQEECNAWYTRNRPDRRVLQGIRLAWAPNGWFDSEDPCTAGTPGWQGITCDPMYGINVLGIDLHNTLIEGDLAEVQFENLPHLETLVLSNNPGLQGVIPPGLGTLPNLTVLYLDQCALHGPIPESFGNSSIAAAALAAQEFAEALNATGQPPLPLALNLRGNWFNGSVPSFFQWMDARIFADNCLDYTSELTPPPSQRSQGTCASFYRQVEKDSPQRFVNPGAYPFRSDPRLPLQPPPGPQLFSESTLFRSAYSIYCC